MRVIAERVEAQLDAHRTVVNNRVHFRGRLGRRLDEDKERAVGIIADELTNLDHDSKRECSGALQWNEDRIVLLRRN